MSKPTQLWPGERMRVFFREVLRAEPQVDEELADRLSERLSRHINRMLVWNDTPNSKAAQQVTKKPEPLTEKETDDDRAINEAGAPWPDADTLNPPHLQIRQQKSNKRKNKNKKKPTLETFDPYAFSAVVILARNGRESLMSRLKEIKAPEHLRQLADAQHLGAPPNINKAEDLRRAIIKGASQRLADRRAAAS